MLPEGGCTADDNSWSQEFLGTFPNWPIRLSRPTFHGM